MELLPLHSDLLFDDFSLLETPITHPFECVIKDLARRCTRYPPSHDRTERLDILIDILRTRKD